MNKWTRYTSLTTSYDYPSCPPPPQSSWGQYYEQRGLVLQAVYTDDAPSAVKWPHGMAEMTALIMRGEPVHMRVYEIPKAAGENGCFDVRLHENGTSECMPTNGCPKDAMDTCRQFRIDAMLPQLRSYAHRISSFFGADWFRFDFFHGHPKRMLSVNELSYPSHHTYPHDIRLGWLRGYEGGRMVQASSDCVVDYLLRSVGVSAEEFEGGPNCYLCEKKQAEPVLQGPPTPPPSTLPSTLPPAHQQRVVPPRHDAPHQHHEHHEHAAAAAAAAASERKMKKKTAIAE